MKGFRQKSESNGLFFVVKHGTICQESKKEREGYEPIQVRDPRSGQDITKYIKPYECLEAMVTKIEWRDVEYDNRRYLSWRIHLNADGEPGVLELPFESRISGRFMRLAENIDFKRPVEFRAWRGTDGNTAFAVQQDGHNVPQKYTKDNPGDCPEPKQSFGGNWDFDGVNEFLYERMLKVVIPAVDAAQRNGHLPDAPFGEEPPPPQILTRDELIAKVKGLCTQLNASGDDPKWNPARLNGFINETYQVTDGLDSLTPDYLQKLVNLLTHRLEEIEVPF